MTAREMQIEFERRLGLINPDLSVAEKPSSDTIFAFLNAAQDRKVEMEHLRDDQTEQGTNTSNRSADSIKSLVIEKELLQSGITSSGMPRFRLPNVSNEEYFLYIDSVSKVSGTYKQYPSTTRVNLENEMVKYDELSKYLATAFNKPIIRKPAVAFMSDSSTKYNYLVVAVDSYTTVHSIVLMYYRRPLRFNTITGGSVISECELPNSVHNEIVDMAVEMFITEAKYRLNTKQPDNNQQ